MRRPAGGGGGDLYGGDSSAGDNPHAYANPSATPPPHMHQQHHQQPQQQHSKAEHHNRNQWRWERDGSKVQSPMSPNMFNEGQGSEASRSYYQAQRPEPRMAPERQGSRDPRSQSRGEEMSIGYEANLVLQSYEGLEQKFLDDIMKLSKEQVDAEDAEIARHRERINVINAQYQEQLVALRARHASRRDEFLRRESHSRQRRYQQASMDNYPTSDPQGYNAVATPARESHLPYNADSYDSHRERERFLGSGRNTEFEPRVQYPGGRVYDTGSRFY